MRPAFPSGAARQLHAHVMQVLVVSSAHPLNLACLDPTTPRPSGQNPGRMHCWLPSP